MSRRRKVLLGLLIFFGGCHLLEGPPFYYSEDIRGRVIDEYTGKPAEGAIVLAVWSVDGWMDYAVLYASEGVADANGDFCIPGMPPRLRPIGRWFQHLSEDPRLHVYKFGYRSESLTGNIDLPWDEQGGAWGHRWWWIKRTCYWTGKTIPLQPAKNEQEKIEAFKRLHSEAEHYVEGKTGPKRLPQVWDTLVSDYRKFPPNTFRSIGDPQEYVDYWGKGLRK